MPFVSDHPISGRWPASDPGILQLYSFPTPNGVKISIALEEVGLPYEAHTVKLSETTTPEFLSLNPNNKIPAIIDPDGPDGSSVFSMCLPVKKLKIRVRDKDTRMNQYVYSGCWINISKEKNILWLMNTVLLISQSGRGYVLPKCFTRLKMP